MNLMHHPEALDRIAAAYALGTLRGGARRRFETMAREQAAVRAAALVWQARLSGMTELQEQHTPAQAVWTRIHNLVQADQQQARMQSQRVAAPAAAATVAAAPLAGGWWRSLVLWRGATLAGIAATAFVLVGSHQTQQQADAQIAQLRSELATPQVAYVSVLSDNKSTAAMLVTFDPRNRTLVLQRVGDYHEAGDKSLQLWGLPPAGGPRSLGVLGDQRVLRLSATEGDMRQLPTLAISLEPKGGVPGTGGPTGPVLFKGSLIEKAL